MFKVDLEEFFSPNFEDHDRRRIKINNERKLSTFFFPKKLFYPIVYEKENEFTFETKKTRLRL